MFEKHEVSQPQVVDCDCVEFLIEASYPCHCFCSVHKFVFPHSCILPAKSPRDGLMVEPRPEELCPETVIMAGQQRVTQGFVT